MSRNSKYEQKMKDKGFKKVTLWVPADRECEIKQAASIMCEDEDITIGALRNMASGRIVSMHRN